MSVPNLSISLLMISVNEKLFENIMEVIKITVETDRRSMSVWIIVKAKVGTKKYIGNMKRDNAVQTS